MFEAGNRVIESMADAADSLDRTESTPLRRLEAAAKGESKTEAATKRRTKRNTRVATARASTKAIRHAKAGARGVKGGKRAIALEEGRRKSKSGRG
jgi:hypothetical protein